MKTLRQIISEVAQPKAGDEKDFKDKHIIDKVDHPVAPDHAFTGNTKKAPKRRADYDKGEDETVYEGSFDVPTAEGGEHDTEDSHVKYKKGNKPSKAVNEAMFVIPEEILATEKNAFHTAAANAHKSGAKHFAFGGKKYPVTMSKDAASTFAGKGSMKKEAMDPVGKEDGDIDNDGDKDKSDKYLHKRRKAIGKAIRKEETEELDEISRDLARRYIRKVADKTNTGELSTKEVMKRRPGVNLAGKKAYPGIAGEPKVRATESVEQLDELSPNTLKSYTKKAGSNLQKHQRKTKDWDSRTDSRSGKIMNYPWKGGEAPSKETEDKTRKAVSKRSTGIMTARGKLGMKKNSFTAKVKAKESFDLSDLTLEELEDFMMSEDFDQLDEISKKTLGSYIKKANISAMDQARKSGEYNNPDQPKNFSKAMDRMRGIKKATDKLVAKEEVEQLDELSPDTLSSYASKANIDASKARSHMRVSAGGKDFATHKKRYDKRTTGAMRAGEKYRKLLAREEVEQLDELSPNTLHSYIKKAAGNMAGNAAVAAAQASSSMKKSSPDVKRKIKNRMMGISGASGRLADKANVNEDAYEEIPMMMRQLEYIAYAAEEIMEYLDMDVDPEEWYQNKLAAVHHQMQSLHAYMEGDKRMMAKMNYDMDYDMYGEEVEQIDEISQDKLRDYHAAAALDLKKKREKLDKGTLTSKDYKQGQNRVTGLNRSANKMEEVELEEDITKMSHGRLKWHMNSGVPHGSYTKDEMKKERDRRLKTDPMGYRSAKAGLNEVTHTALKKTISYTDAQGKSKTRNVPVSRVDRDEEGEEKIRESVELTEVFNQGIVKLKDGSSVILKKEDADLLNQMLKDLSSANRKKMEEVAMKDKTGFNEILGFAREAL